MEAAMRRWLSEYLILTRIQALELRTWGPITVFVTMLFPLLMIFGFGSIGGGVSREGLVYVVTGSAVVALVTISITATSQELGTLRQSGAFAFYASLPISKSGLVTAILSVRVITALPGLALTLCVGAWLYALPIRLSPAALVLLPLTVLSLSGIGAAIGTLIADFRVVALLSQVAVVVAMFGAPVLIPLDSLPAPLQWLSLVLPPTYAADGFRRALFGVADQQLAVDILALGVCAVVSLVSLSRGLPWRLD
jgi:ABC-2 type transport system permease protein